MTCFVSFSRFCFFCHNAFSCLWDVLCEVPLTENYQFWLWQLGWGEGQSLLHLTGRDGVLQQRVRWLSIWAHIILRSIRKHLKAARHLRDHLIRLSFYSLKMETRQNALSCPQLCCSEQEPVFDIQNQVFPLYQLFPSLSQPQTPFIIIWYLPGCHVWKIVSINVYSLVVCCCFFK